MESPAFVERSIDLSPFPGQVFRFHKINIDRFLAAKYVADFGDCLAGAEEAVGELFDWILNTLLLALFVKRHHFRLECQDLGRIAQQMHHAKPRLVDHLTRCVQWHRFVLLITFKNIFTKFSVVHLRLKN